VSKEKASKKMGFIKTVFWLLTFVVIIAVGGFAYLTYTYPSPYDKYGVWDTVNKNLPVSVRKFTCEKAKEKSGGNPVEGCENL
jgi:hypothetical protein